MSKIDFIRAWKDEDYRLSLSGEERAQLPQNPAGIIDLSESELEVVVGASTEHIQTLGCCNGFTSDPGYCSWVCGGGTQTNCHTECTRACQSPLNFTDEEGLY